jgi:hypothetical protein
MGLFDVIEKVGDGISHIPVPLNPFRMVREASEIAGGKDPVDVLNPIKEAEGDVHYWKRNFGGPPYREVPWPTPNPGEFPHPDDPRYKNPIPQPPQPTPNPSPPPGPDPAPNPGPGPAPNPGPGPAPDPGPAPGPAPGALAGALDVFDLWSA